MTQPRPKTTIYFATLRSGRVRARSAHGSKPLVTVHPARSYRRTIVDPANRYGRKPRSRDIMAIMAAIERIWDFGDDATHSTTPQGNRQRTARNVKILEFDSSETRPVFYDPKRDDTPVATMIQRDYYDFTRQRFPSHVFTSPDWERKIRWAAERSNLLVQTYCRKVCNLSLKMETEKDLASI
jgi:hypothetical protein